MYFEKSKFLYVHTTLFFREKSTEQKMFKKMNSNREVKKQTNKLN